jgi:3-isopropylmalate/(R)-2-methylmalate dehydratase large subunit
MPTLFENVWKAHAVRTLPSGQTQLFVGLHLVHEVTSPQAFDMVRQHGWRVAFPQRTFATVDHIVPTSSQKRPFIDLTAEEMTSALEKNCREFGIQLYAPGAAGGENQGIVHVIGPELGLTQPGMTIACGDSHTSTHGAVGALAFGIGATEVAHVLATQSLWQRKPKALRITLEGRLGQGVGAKDVILAIIAKIGAGGATGHVIEYAGPVMRGMSMEGRFTVCNMSIEAGARAGMIAPDDTTFNYLSGKPFAPQAERWDQEVSRWRALASDPGASFDKEVSIDVSSLRPMVTWGNSPEDALPIDGRVPDPATAPNAERKVSMQRALDYMGLTPGMPMDGLKIDRAFIGSCTNGRIEDLKAAAAVVKGRKVARSVEAWVVPGSGLVKQEAEALGLDRVFTEAGFQWREAGCSMCLGTNGDTVAPGERSASTTNRNFVGRQGPGSRTHLMSPAMVAAAALNGHLTDVRPMLAEAN